MHHDMKKAIASGDLAKQRVAETLEAEERGSYELHAALLTEHYSPEVVGVLLHSDGG
jgi:hypothetical protein